MIAACNCWSWRDGERIHSIGSLMDGTPPQCEDQWRSSNRRQSRPCCPKTFEMAKGKEIKLVPQGVEPRDTGLSRQHSATEPQHPPTTTPPSSPFITLLWVTVDKIMCWLLHTIVDHEGMVSRITAWGVQWTGLPHSPKTIGDHLIKNNLGCYCSKTIETAKGKKERWWLSSIRRSPSVFRLWGSPVQRCSDSNGPDCEEKGLLHWKPSVSLKVLNGSNHRILCQLA